MNNMKLVKEGLIRRALKALVFNKAENAYQYLKWARELR